MAQRPPVGQGLLINKDSWSHSDIPQSLRLLWMSDQPDAETCTWQHTTLTRDKLPCPRQGSNPASEQPQTHALDCAATGIGMHNVPVT